MQITLKNLGKRYNKDWIFKGINYTFESGQNYAIQGQNGSGKSTLLKILSTHLSPTIGKVTYNLDQDKLNHKNTLNNLSISGPYIDLIEEFTITEAIKFHSKFRPFHNSLSNSQVRDIIQLPNAQKRLLKDLSSGMRQRVRLAISILTPSQLLMLDEPSTNLDEHSKKWLDNLIQEHTKTKTLIIASNEADDFKHTNHTLQIKDYKPN